VSQSPRKVLEGVLQGKAVRKVKPAYPTIARTIRASGPVQVMVVIAEDGRVIEAAAINGNPVLKSAAVEAARQWLFTPTTLNNIPVKVQGLLTFNFVLE
jgi:protein TonB